MNNMKKPLHNYLPWLSIALVIAILAVALQMSNDATVSYDDGGGKGGSVTSLLRGFAEPAVDYAYEESTSSYMALDDSVIGGDIEQHIIKTGYVDIIVTDAMQVSDQLTAIAQQYGGVVTQRSFYQDPYSEKDALAGSVTITVAAEEFDAALTEIRSLAVEIRSESVSANDVTETVIDLEARLDNARAEEQRYVEILASATTVEEILLVEEQLARVRTNIERYEGQLSYYDQRTTYSTITISIEEEVELSFADDAFRPGQTVVDAAQDVVMMFQNIFLGMIRVVIIGGSIVIPVGIIVLLINALQTKKPKKTTKKKK